MSKFLSLIVLAFILYQVMHIQFKGAQVVETKNREDIEIALEGNLFDRMISKVMINLLKTKEGRTFIENLIQPQSDQNYSILKPQDTMKRLFQIQTGGAELGSPASCGDEVVVDYHIKNIDDKAMSSEFAKKTVLGSGGIPSIVENIIVGMYKGQTRYADIPSYYLDNTNQSSGKTSYKLNVTLRDITQGTEGIQSTKIFSEGFAYKMPLFCGQNTSFYIKISNIRGDTIYNSNNKVNMTLGGKEWPNLLSHALFGQVPFGTKTIFTETKHLKNFFEVNKLRQTKGLPEVCIIEVKF